MTLRHRKCWKITFPQVSSDGIKCKALVHKHERQNVVLLFLNLRICEKKKIFLEISAVWITRYGKSDMKGILRSTKKRDFVMYVVYLVETSIWRVMTDPKKYKREPDAIVQTTIIFDLEGLSMQHVTNKQGKNLRHLWFLLIRIVKLSPLHSAWIGKYNHKTW